MFASKVHTILFQPRSVLLNESLLSSHFMHYHGRVNVVWKRGALLTDMITNKDKRKNWHFNILSNKPKVRIFDKVHKPTRRQAVLNSLFITNITDVISTGDIAPEIANYGIEITGVKISPCCKMLNVFWQVPESRFDSSEEIGKLLTAAAPKIRSELISRNVLGRVPFIFFLRDGTNAKIAAFEYAMKKLDLEPDSESSIILDDSFTKDIYSFKTDKVVTQQNPSIDDTKEEILDSDRNDTKGESLDSDIDDNTKKETLVSPTDDKKILPTIPQKPPDMKCDIFGLNHELLMGKVIALKKIKKVPQEKTAVISVESLTDEDLFTKIPGVCFQPDTSRKNILKKFHIERKILKEKKKVGTNIFDNAHHTEDYIEESDNTELNSFDEDFLDDDPENSR